MEGLRSLQERKNVGRDTRSDSERLFRDILGILSKLHDIAARDDRPVAPHRIAMPRNSRTLTTLFCCQVELTPVC